jgi:iron-sulfur cluster assembly protein
LYFPADPADPAALFAYFGGYFMAITLTENAAKQIQRQLAKREKGLALRIGIKKMGCSGLAHTFDIAEEIHAGDHTFESHNALLVLDGSRIDYVTEGLNQMFKFDNPNVESECGCGESFNLKVKSEVVKA